MNDKYKIIGPLYDFLAMIFSFGQIDKCKVAMHEHIKPDDKVLFAGVGQGIDAIEAAQRGAEVTVVDLSESMLNIFTRRTQGRYFTHTIRQVHQDILKFDEYEQFDVVYANFFLNVFPQDMVVQVLEHLSKLAKKGGFVVVGDFSLPSGSIISRLFQNIYWYIADIIFVIMAKNAFHPVYDYQSQMKGLGLNITDLKYFRFLFDNRYYSIRAQK
ncbi:MAG TPA: class I SAM-dependent methyltransferase [Deltaproteobacteria bacterium]|nr:class I SAM-dependent methyltransferase [Deltaproteobacteria bacterium]HPR52953.1 class I SAM-dependent methyltransferase [Deltaproteobacteria bacterium]